MKKHTVIALDLAKTVIQITKVSQHGEIVYNKAQSPDKIRKILTQSSPCIVAMEGCGSAQYWSRYAQECGHEARMMSPRKVKAYVAGQKNDANDAIGVAIACLQPTMTFAPIKTLEQQTLQSVNTSRKFLDKTVTALSNHLRGIIYEYGQTIPKGVKGLRERIVMLLAPENISLSPALKTLVSIMWEQYKLTKQQLSEVNKQLDSLTKDIEPCSRLQKIEGVGPKSACLLYAAIGNGEAFKNGRVASVYTGVTPAQYSSGGKSVLLGITKHGDATLRSTMYQGALSVISNLKPEAVTQKHQWLLDLVRRVGTKRACIALVNKNIRTAWAMLKNNTEYQPVYL
jgi:transposase